MSQFILFWAVYVGGMAITITLQAFECRGAWQYYVERWDLSPKYFLQMFFWPWFAIWYIPVWFIRYVIFGLVRKLTVKSAVHEVD